jgi:formylglycine-generating enzyme required for sulfatase activity
MLARYFDHIGYGLKLYEYKLFFDSIFLSFSGHDVNYNGNYSYRAVPKEEYRKKITPVNKFCPNAFGLYSMHSNVSEWCKDSWHENYKNAQKDGNSWNYNDFQCTT